MVKGVTGVGFGLTDEAALRKERSAAQRKTLNSLIQSTQSGVGRGSAGVGFAVGTALSKLAGKAGLIKDDEMNRAKRITKAGEEADSQAAAMVTDPEADPFSAQIERGRIMQKQLQADGLQSEADAVGTQLLQLAVQQQAFFKEAGAIEKQGLTIEEMKREAKARKLDGDARDEVTRLMNLNANLDPTDPEQAARMEVNNARIKKLNAMPKGATEFDIPYDKVTVRAVEKHMGASIQALDGFVMAKDSFNPDFLTLKDKGINFALKYADIAGLPLTDEMKESLTEFTTFKQVTSQNLNAYIKAITGAQMSNPEAVRLRKDVPTDDDSPKAYQQKLDNIIEQLQAAVDRDLAALAVSDDPNEFRKTRAIPLSEFVKKNREKKDAEGQSEEQEVQDALTALQGLL